MIEPHEEISYLVRSENRVRVLEALLGSAKTRREVVEETGISGVTVGRIIAGFLDRGWILVDGDAFETTVVGDLIVADYRRLFDSTDLACRLGPVIEHVSFDEMDFDVRCLTDAAISDPETFDPLRAMDRQMQLFREADRVQAFTHRLPNFLGEVIYEEVIQNDLKLEVVFEAELVDRLADTPTIRSRTVEAIQAGAEIYRADDTDRIPLHAGTFDDLVAIAVHDDAGSICLGIETRSEPIVGWVNNVFEEYREAATRLTARSLRA
ncbi:MAG: helix-turn-helix transcriptional regulator [Halobacteriota archaeon]